MRNKHPALFVGGAYEAVEAHGARARNVVAYLRRSQGAAALVVVPRFPIELGRDAEHMWAPDWQDTSLDVPADLQGGTWRHAFTGNVFAGPPTVEMILGAFPVAILILDEA
ncbi:MAG: hypothetical protein WD766_01985 [Gemmatimonadota bacterium]